MLTTKFTDYFNDVLQVLRDLGGSGTPTEVRDFISERRRFSEAELSDTIPSGISRLQSQVGWARSYLTMTGYLESSKRGVWSLTERGQTAVLTDGDIQQIVREVRARRPVRQMQTSVIDATDAAVEENSAPPDSANVSGEDHREQLLKIMQILPPAGFERLCQRLLREAGFEQVIVTKQTGDGGIDGHGLLQINPLVSFKVLFQCKRYQGSVGSGAVRDFRGSMDGRTDKGIILTTGTFTAEAQREAIRDGATPIELVDSEKLLTMFENLELGVKPRKTFDVDVRFFEEFS